jgi:UrcA family protein
MQTFSRTHSTVLAATALLLVQSGIACAQEAPRATHERTTTDSPYTIQYSTVVAGPGLRQAGKVAVSLPVSYADLDLGTAAGVEALKERVKVAARQVCRQIDLRDPGSVAESRACVETTASSALEKMGTVVASRTGGAKLAALP